MDNNALLDKLILQQDASTVSLEERRAEFVARKRRNDPDPEVDRVISVSKDGTRLQAVIRQGNMCYTRHLRLSVTGTWVGRTCNSEVSKKMGQRLQESGRAAISTRSYSVPQDMITRALRRQP